MYASVRTTKPKTSQYHTSIKVLSRDLTFTRYIALSSINRNRTTRKAVGLGDKDLAAILTTKPTF